MIMTRYQYLQLLIKTSKETCQPIKPTDFLAYVPEEDRKIAASAFVDFQSWKSSRLKSL